MKTTLQSPDFVIDRVYIDENGNKTIKVITINSNIKLYIQTNVNLPITHRNISLGKDGFALNQDITKEINKYISDYFNGFKK